MGLKQEPSSANKHNKFKQRSSNNISNDTNKSKFVGVRQRPSGKWVAEIKDTTKKIRMWLGTFETAEEAARAYDEAACLLRGANTRTNFTTSTHIPASNSPLSLKIKNLLNHKKKQQQQSPSLPPNTIVTLPKASTRVSSSTITTDYHDMHSVSSSQLPSFVEVSDETYRPDISNCIGELHQVPATLWLDQSWQFLSEFDHQLPQNPNENGVVVSPPPQHAAADPIHQITSASFYGVNEYLLENTYDANDALLWDLPTLSHLFCLG